MPGPLDSSYDPARARRQQEQDAIIRALQAQAAQAGSNLAASAGNMNAPTEALAAVNSIPQSMANTLQTQQIGRNAIANQQFEAEATNRNAFAQNLLASLAETGKIQSNMDALRSKWAEADLVGKMNLAQQTGKDKLAQIEAERAQAQEDRQWRAQEHAYRLAEISSRASGSRGRGRGSGGGSSGRDWTESASGQRLLYQIERDLMKDESERQQGLSEAAGEAWGLYQSSRDAGKIPLRQLMSQIDVTYGPEVANEVRRRAPAFYAPTARNKKKPGAVSFRWPWEGPRYAVQRKKK